MWNIIAFSQQPFEAIIFILTSFHMWGTWGIERVSNVLQGWKGLNPRTDGVWYQRVRLNFVISSFVNCTEWFHLGTLYLAVVGVFSSVQFSSVTQSCPILCDPMDCSTWGLPVHHQLPEFTHIHWVGGAIQPSHPLLSPSSPAFNLSQHQGLFQWVSSLH